MLQFLMKQTCTAEALDTELLKNQNFEIYPDISNPR